MYHIYIIYIYILRGVRKKKKKDSPSAGYVLHLVLVLFLFYSPGITGDLQSVYIDLRRSLGIYGDIFGTTLREKNIQKNRRMTKMSLQILTKKS